jgi:hypothetical protein
MRAASPIPFFRLDFITPINLTEKYQALAHYSVSFISYPDDGDSRSLQDIAHLTNSTFTNQKPRI